MRATYLTAITSLLVAPALMGEHFLEEKHGDGKSILIHEPAAVELNQRLTAPEFRDAAFDIILKADDASGLSCVSEIGQKIICSFKPDQLSRGNGYFKIPFLLTDKGVSVNDSSGAAILYGNILAADKSLTCPPKKGAYFVNGPLTVKKAMLSGLICMHNSQNDQYRCRLDLPKQTAEIKTSDDGCDFDYSRAEP